MNHIFYSQNKISYLIIKEIIKVNKIDPADCTIITTGKLSRQRSTIHEIDSSKYQIASKVLFFLSWKQLSDKKKLLSEDLRLNEPFIFYNSNYSFWFLNYLRRHPNCKSNRYIEEGSSACYTRAEVERINNVRFRFNLRFRAIQLIIWLNHCFSHTLNPFKSYDRIQECDVVYALSHEAYGHSNVEVIEDVFEYVEHDVPCDIIWAPSALTNNNSFVSIDDLTSVFNEVISILSEKDYKNVLIKLHPRENMKIKQYFKTVKSNINLILDESGVPVENLLYSRDIALLTDISSLALYAKILRRPCYSYSHKICAVSNKFGKVYQLLPSKLKSILTPLDQMPKFIRI